MPKPAQRPSTQLHLAAKRRGGWRAKKGGRRKGVRTSRFVAHTRRPSLSPRHPVHITLRVMESVPNLRKARVFRYIRRCIQLGHKEGFRVVEFSVMRNHLHLIVEAGDRRQLARGVQGLKVRFARRLNRLFGRRGTFFADRYHARIIKTPREAKNALAYVLNNARRHAAQAGRGFPKRWLDPFSSAADFDGFDGPTRARRLGERVNETAETWLLSKGWRIHGLLDPSTVPGAG